MRSCDLIWVGLAAIALVACGPAGPSSLEGFGDGETGDGDGDPTGDGDGEPTGDGDGDGDCIVDAHLGAQLNVYFEGELDDSSGDDVINQCNELSIGDHTVTWTAPISGPFRAEVFAEFFGSLTMLRGGCDGSFQDCFIGSPAALELEAIAGQDYTFVIDGESPGWFSFQLYPLDVMPSSCPEGELFGTHESVFGSTLDASNDFNASCGGEAAPDRAYLFFPPVSGTYRIDTIGSSYDTLLSVFASACTEGSELACNDDASGTDSAVEVQLSAGQVYTIVVDGWTGAAGDYQLNLELLDGQSDFCDGAEALPPGGPLEIDWSSEMNSGDVYQGCSMSSFERRFSWSAPQDGLWIVRLLGDGPVGLAILEDCEGSSATCDVGSTAVELQLLASAGKQYVFVTEWEPTGPGSLELQVESIPDVGCGEDLGAEAPSMFSGTTAGSGDEHDGTCAVNPAPERELHWTAPATGSYRFSLEGSSYDTLLYIRDGGCDGAELGCSDDTVTQLGLQLWSSLELELGAGQTVSIFVDGYSGTGDFELAITQL